MEVVRGYESNARERADRHGGPDQGDQKSTLEGRDSMTTPSKNLLRGPARDTSLDELTEQAQELRRIMLRMASDKGEGYIAQGLGIADILAAVYFRELRFNPEDPEWVDRDKFVLSTGHYSIALFAAMQHAGYFPAEELDTFGLNGSDLPLSTFDSRPGVEVSGGSLGHGLGQAIGMALANRIGQRPGRVICELSDGEMQEGSTWEAAAAAYTFRLDDLIAVVDCNGVQADGNIVLDFEPVADKWAAFGWEVREIDGNDMTQVVAAFDALREPNGKPKVIIARTTPGSGVPTLEQRERAHFVRVEDGEWKKFKEELEETYVSGR